MRFLIYGAGAIGAYIGGSLSIHGSDVVFLERPGVAEELRERGFALKLEDQTHLIPHPKIASSIEEALTFGPFDLTVFAVKSFDTQPVITNLVPYKAALPPVLCLQNGVENESLIASMLGSDKVIAGSVTTAIGKAGIGEIILERKRGIGIAAGHPLAPSLVDALNRANLNARIFANAASMKWSKMLTNMLANATSAILDMPPESIFQDPRLFHVEVAQIREALKVMRANQINVVNLPGTPVQALAAAIDYLPEFLSRPALTQQVAKGRGDKMPSFHIDLYAQRGKSEVDYLNGAVVRFGDRCRVPTPVNRALTTTLLGLTRHELSLDDFAHRPEALFKVIENFQSREVIKSSN